MPSYSKTLVSALRKTCQERKLDCEGLKKAEIIALLEKWDRKHSHKVPVAKKTPTASPLPIKKPAAKKASGKLPPKGFHPSPKAFKLPKDAVLDYRFGAYVTKDGFVWTPSGLVFGVKASDMIFELSALNIAKAVKMGYPLYHVEELGRTVNYPTTYQEMVADKLAEPIFLVYRPPKRMVQHPRKQAPLKDEKPPSPKPPRKKGVPYVPGVYEEVQLSFEAETPKPGTKAPPSIGITFPEFRQEIENPDFIKAFTQSSKDLMATKLKFYTAKQKELTKELEETQKKVDDLRDHGASDSDISSIFPNHKFMRVFLLDLANLIKEIETRIAETTEEVIKEGLLSAIEDPDRGLESIVGREEIKDQISSQLYAFSKGYQVFLGSFNNIVIMGPAGVGKTVIAQVIAFSFSQAGILATDKVKIVTRADLVGQYIGQTAPQTRRVLLDTLEGVLFIDEAYELTACPEQRVTGYRDFGSEAMTEMVNFLDKYVGMNVVIVAGYQEPMERCFLTFNEGIPRRFPYRYYLSNFTSGQLTDILVRALKRRLQESITIDRETSNFLFSIINALDKDKPRAFKNQGGDILNLATLIIKAINSSYKVQWKNGDLKHNLPILLAGLNDFLANKGLRLGKT